MAQNSIMAMAMPKNGSTMIQYSRFTLPFHITPSCESLRQPYFASLLHLTPLTDRPLSTTPIVYCRRPSPSHANLKPWEVSEWSLRIVVR